MPRVIGLGDPAATEVAVGGAKGAGLARARAAGFPVLDGFVVSPAASVGALVAGREVLESAGSGGARMAVIRAQLEDSLLAEIAAAAADLPEPLIVRSSSVLEGGGEWAGAFTSVPEVRRDEIPKATRSVWATCFTLDVLDRFEAAGLEPGSASMGVLVQPEIVPDFGGAASIDAQGAVTVTAVKGSPRDLMAGWAPGVRAVYEPSALIGEGVLDPKGQARHQGDERGELVGEGVVDPRGQVRHQDHERGALMGEGAVDLTGQAPHQGDEGGGLVGDEALALMGQALLQDLVDLARRVQAELGHDRIEWASLAGQVVLLQVQGSSERGSAANRSAAAEVRGPVAVPAALAHPYARELARMTHRYPGALGEELVLGWLPGMSGPVEPRPIGPLPADADADAGAGADSHAAADAGDADGNGRGAERERLLSVARELAAELTAQAWGEPPEQALARARLVLRRLRSDRPNESIEVLGELRPVDAGAAATLLGLYERLAATSDPRQRRGRDRWEPLLAGVAALQGETFAGEPSVGGIGAGRLVWVESPSQTEHVRPRDILVTQYPLANFSPLLWDAAGVITLGGAPSAHLFEVARSLTVPAVVNCTVGDVIRPSVRAHSVMTDSARTEGVLGMVDGDAGRVAVLR